MRPLDAGVRVRLVQHHELEFAEERAAELTVYEAREHEVMHRVGVGEHDLRLLGFNRRARASRRVPVARRRRDARDVFKPPQERRVVRVVEGARVGEAPRGGGEPPQLLELIVGERLEREQHDRARAPALAQAGQQRHDVPEALPGSRRRGDDDGLFLAQRRVARGFLVAVELGHARLAQHELNRAVELEPGRAGRVLRARGEPVDVHRLRLLRERRRRLRGDIRRREGVARRARSRARARALRGGGTANLILPSIRRLFLRPTRFFARRGRGRGRGRVRVRRQTFRGILEARDLGTPEVTREGRSRGSRWLRAGRDVLVGAFRALRRGRHPDTLAVFVLHRQRTRGLADRESVLQLARRVGHHARGLRVEGHGEVDADRRGGRGPPDPSERLAVRPHAP